MKATDDFTPGKINHHKSITSRSCDCVYFNRYDEVGKKELHREITEAKGKVEDFTQVGL